MLADAEMPRYRCHKEVWALKIKSISGLTITPVESAYAPFEVSRAYMEKHKPQAGGYYVVYANNYESFSPAQAFEEGYTRIEE